MAANITGIVYNDLNLNGKYDPGEPGIPGVNVVLVGSTGCTTIQTDSDGNYTFSAVAGSYNIYETVQAPNACPPTELSQPAGFNTSNGPRKLTVTVTTAQSNNGVTLSGYNFGHSLNNSSIACDSTFIQFAGIPTIRYDIDIVTGESVPAGSLNPADYVNAIGLNPLDSFIYGYDQTTHNMVRVDADNNITALLPNPLGLPAADYTTGTFDANGFFYLYNVNTARYYTIDLRPNSPTYMKLVNPAAGFVEQASNFGTALSTPIYVSDWSINPRDGYLYGVNRSGNVVRVVPTTGAVTVLTTTGPKEGVETSYGAAAFDYNGNLYAIANSSGVIRKYTIGSNSANGSIFSQSVATSNNDGTMCLFATVDVDYGDAPDQGPGNGFENYNTLLQNNGPRHGLINDLFLGTQVTAETDAHQNFDATGDDLTQGIQDDGLDTPLPPLPYQGGPYVLDVRVTNNTGQPANLYGWIDFNQNGLFESYEAAPVMVVPSAPGLQTIPLNFDIPGGFGFGQTFVRLRLTTDDLIDQGGIQDTRSVGAASDGEVEDYIVGYSEAADLSIFKSGSPKPVRAGELLTYTLVVNNAGPNVAVNTVLTDDVPPELVNDEYSEDGGISWYPWTGSLSLGDLYPGESRIIYLRGIAQPSGGANIIENTATIESETPDPNPDNNTSTDVTDVEELADLAVYKYAEPSPVATNSLLTYTVKVVNNGPSEARDVVLNDDIPAELENIEYSTDGGSSWQPWTGPIGLGTLPSGFATDILIRGLVRPDSAGVIQNTATIESPTPTPDPGNNTDTVLTPIDNAADLAITKTGTPKPVLPGQELVYGLTVSNYGPDTAFNTVITDVVPTELSNVEYSEDGGTTWQAWTGSLNIGDRPANSYFAILIRGLVDTGASGLIENTATISSDTPDPNPDNNTATDITPVDLSADLSIVKQADPRPVTAGELLTFVLTVSNAGPSTATNVILSDDIPSQILNPEFAADGSPVFAPWVSPYNLGTLDAGRSTTIVIRGTVAPGTAAGTIIDNTAVVSSDTPDPNPDDNSDEIEVPVEVSADLAVTKTANSTAAVPGEQLTYTVRVANLGPSDALQVTLIDAVSSQLHNPEYSLDNGASWLPWTGSLALGSIAAADSREILVRGTVDLAATGSIINTATVTSPTPDPDPDNNTDEEEVPVEPIADISVVKTASPNPVATGFPVTYTLQVQNFGPATAENVALTDSLPSGTADGEFSLDGGATWSPWAGMYLIGDLALNESRTILLRATVTAAAANPLSNTATVTSDTTDPNPDNNTSTAVIDVILSSDLAVTKTAELDPVQPGQVLTYAIRVQNFGPGTAQNVVVNDLVPSELENPEYSIDGGATWLPWSGTYPAGDLASGAELTLLVRGTVNAEATGRLVNTATVTSDTPDPNPDNNTSENQVCVCPGCPPAAEADLAVTKSALQSPVEPGATISYTLTVQNSGPDASENTLLYDSVPSAITNPEYSLDGGQTWQIWVNPLPLGILSPDEIRSVLIRGQVSPNAIGSIENTAVVSSNTPDPDPNNNTSTSIVPVGPRPGLRLNKSANPCCAAPCQPILFILRITNDSSIPAENVVVTDQLPAGFISAQYFDLSSRAWRPWAGHLRLGTVAAGETRIVQLKGIFAGTASRCLRNTARVLSSTSELVGPSSTASATVSIIGNSGSCSQSNWYC